ncbi:MAG: CNNM domain-containing protein, partial [Sediminibacterium sp.]|nr:CNNM domain-containing protein [Sediminibacterium sp.]
MTHIYTILSIVGTLLFIGFFAGYEIAFVTANRLSIELKKKQGKRSGAILAQFIESPARFIGTCLIGVNVFLVIYGLLFDELLKTGIWLPLEIENNL